MAFETSSLLLLPASSVPVEEPHTLRSLRRRRKRSIETHTAPRKYHRLAHSVHVQSDIRYRYATTLVTSSIRNPESESREIFLTVILPDTAFISRFAIEVAGQLFVAFVKEKEEAWREYQQAVQTGKTAGHVGISARHSNHFRVSVNTEAKSSVVFFLLYEELLQRRAGTYEHVINLTPRQRLKDFKIEVNVLENRNLTHLHVPALRRHEISTSSPSDTDLKGVSITRKHSGKSAFIRYEPDVGELEERLRGKHALQFVIEYDVDRPDKAGEIQVVDGYFVHFVAPEKLPPMPRHVVFVLDTSGSMQGKKILQTKAAMRTILAELREGDVMTIVTFANDVSTWDDNDMGVVVDVNRHSIRRAMGYVESIEPRGGTNLNEALIQAMTIITHVRQHGLVNNDHSAGRRQAMIFFLTDGRATEGETDTQRILDNTKAANDGGATALFCLAFGRHADFDLLKVLSLQNNAFARKIYVAADASLQLEGFYKEVSSPILRDVKFRYQDDEILSHTLTATNFHTYYQGSEMVVAGRLPPYNTQDGSDQIIQYEILATQAEGQKYEVEGSYNGSEAHYYPQEITEMVFDVLPEVRASAVNFLERLWAYLTIQDLLRKVAQGEFNSCSEEDFAKEVEEEEEARMRYRRTPPTIRDDEDYVDYEGSGSASSSADPDDDDDWASSDEVTDIMDVVGDADIVICNNLERALYLSLKYEFVTPLTSLVVVKPGITEHEEGDFGELGADIRLMSGSTRALESSALLVMAAAIALSRRSI